MDDREPGASAVPLLAGLPTTAHNYESRCFPHRAPDTRMKRKHFEVRSAWNARFFRSDRPWAAIQISSGADHPELNDENRVGLVRLVFEDTWEAETDGSFNAGLAQEVLEFVEAMWNRVELFLIHCEVGMSRSPAVAAALSRIHYNDDGRWFEMYFPNPLVYRLLLDVATRASRQP